MFSTFDDTWQLKERMIPINIDYRGISLIRLGSVTLKLIPFLKWDMFSARFQCILNINISSVNINGNRLQLIVNGLHRLQKVEHLLKDCEGQPNLSEVSAAQDEWLLHIQIWGVQKNHLTVSFRSEF